MGVEKTRAEVKKMEHEANAPTEPNEPIDATEPPKQKATSR